MAINNGPNTLTLTATRADSVTFNSSQAVIVGDPNATYISFDPPTTTHIANAFQTSIVIDMDFGAANDTSSAQAKTTGIEANKIISFTGATSGNAASLVSILSNSTIAFGFGSANESDAGTLLDLSVVYTEANILSATPIRVGEVFTVTTDGIPDLTTMTVTATYGGINLGAGSNITATTVEFTAPLFGLQLGANHELIVGVA